MLMYNGTTPTYRGTTPTHIFEIPGEVASSVKEIKITYSQRDREILVKRTEDCTIGENTITTKLTQEDTFKFECNAMVAIQIRVLTTSDDALISEPITITVGKCLDEEILV